jgi:hypothetical protein
MAPAPLLPTSVVGHRYATPIAHIVPLLALWRLRARSVESAFLLNGPQHHRGRIKDLTVLEIDHRGELETELAAYRLFKPDVVVDDCSLTTGTATHAAGVARVAIVRTGVFEGYVPKDARQRHSLQVGPAGADGSGLSLPSRLSDLFRASVHLVPGIPTVEVVPDSVGIAAPYVFAGPLLLRRSDATAHGFAPKGLTRAEVAAFCDAHRRDGRPIVFVTSGTNWKPEALRACVRRLLDLGLAVMTTCVIDDVDPSGRERYCGRHFLPMHEACVRADVVVHQCGSGTYHYPLVHGVPTVTIGSGCFDRDDVAKRLEELGVSTHVPDRDGELCVSQIVDAVHASIERKQSTAYRHDIAALQREIDRVRAAFDFEGVLRRALAGRP